MIIDPSKMTSSSSFIVTMAAFSMMIRPSHVLLDFAIGMFGSTLRAPIGGEGVVPSIAAWCGRSALAARGARHRHLRSIRTGPVSFGGDR